MNFFDPDRPIGFLKGDLPHWRQDGSSYFVTFRLIDSLPKSKLDQWRSEKNAWLKANPKPHTSQQMIEFHNRFTDRMQRWLDSGYGSRILSLPEIRKIVNEAICHFRERYELDAYTVASNHAHAIVTPSGKNTLSSILHSWKSFSAHKIIQSADARKRLEIHQRTSAASTPLKVWQKESFDHIIRSPGSLERFRLHQRSSPMSSTKKSGSGVPPLTTQSRDGSPTSQSGSGVPPLTTQSRDGSPTSQSGSGVPPLTQSRDGSPHYPTSPYLETHHTATF